MRSPRPSVSVLISLMMAVHSVFAADSLVTQEDLNKVVDAFYGEAQLDATAVYEVENAVLAKDTARFTLKSGTLHVARPVQGFVTTAVFIGDAQVLIEPVRPMDRLVLDIAAKEHMQTTLGGRVDLAATEVFILSFDDSLGNLLKSVRRKEVADLSKASRLLEERLKVALNQELAFDIALVEKTAGLDVGPLFVDFNTKEHGWLAYYYGPDSQEEVFLGARDKVGMFDILRPLIVTHRREDLSPSGEYIADPRRDQKDRIDTTKYKMEITIPDAQHFLVEVDVRFTPLRQNLPVVRFDLVNNIAGVKTTDEAKPIYVRKLTDAQGKPLPYVHRKNQVVIIPPEPLRMGEEYTYHFSLDEQTIIQNSSVHYEVLNTYPWFPQHGYNGGQYAMDWTIKARRPLYATGSGKILSEKVEGQFNVTHLTLETPVQFPSLIFGEYQKAVDTYKAIDGREISLAAFSAPVAQFMLMDTEFVYVLTKGRERNPIPFDLTVPSGRPGSILDETKGILKFCETLYGPYPFSSLQVAEMSPFKGYGQAPPAFVQLTGEAFMNPAAEVRFGDYYLDFSAAKMDFFHEFFAHEIAHQWWGHALQWVADEDQWLSESFAEYTAGLYIMQYLGQERFQGKLKEWRDRARLADPHGTIAWSNNLSGQNSGSWRFGLIYNKGAYVLHMLRMQIGHENYVKAMKNAIAKYRFQQITTDELRREIELVVGYKLDFFFDQWFRGTGIPTFDYSTSMHQADDGKWVATVKISQRDKANVKIVNMPVFFHFGKDKVVVKERPILKAEDVYQVKLPEKPQRITLDDYRTLLAEIVAQDPAAL